MHDLDVLSSDSIELYDIHGMKYTFKVEQLKNEYLFGMRYKNMNVNFSKEFPLLVTEFADTFEINYHNFDNDNNFLYQIGTIFEKASNFKTILDFKKKYIDTHPVFLNGAIVVQELEKKHKTIRLGSANPYII